MYQLVGLALSLASVSLAAPLESSVNPLTDYIVDIGNGIQVEVYHPPPNFETFGTGIDHPLWNVNNSTLEEATLAFVQSRLNVSTSNIVFTSGYSGEVANHTYVAQTHDGIPFANAVANVAFNHDNKVVSFGSSFVKPATFPPSAPSITVDEAISTAESAVSGKYNGHPATIEFLAMKNGSVALTHAMQIQNNDTGTWYKVFVDAHANQVLSITDFSSQASYRAVPITRQSPLQGFEVITNPQNLASSPAGWHLGNDNATLGNNAISFTFSSTGGPTVVTPQSGPDLAFIYVQNPSLPPTVSVNQDAARTNAFYVVNTVHDITYQYGFTERAFNFQFNNFGHGGLGNDQVEISVQDFQGINNAFFFTPPDGQSGRMTLHLFTSTNPNRDSALANDVVAHEFAHGVTNRMTGGGTGVCLTVLESRGLGEGWSDAFAEWLTHVDASVPDFVIGQYLLNNPAGFRTHPYSTSRAVNPLTYGSVRGMTVSHNIGEVWANILHNVYAALVAAQGFSSTAHTNASGTAGNVVFLHLFIDGLAIQPCNPTFIYARNAWIQADLIRYNGAHNCILWRAFASRGLGVNANNFIDNGEIPQGC